ncbi:MAG: hypothetical protein LLF95_06400 [Bacteroidales bacterium]|nr:hypothetical protein [Bacteroidales bacterium]
MATENNLTTINPNNMSVVERVKAPTPKFFRTLRTIGLTLAAIGGAILASPIALPAGLVAAAGYIVLAGGVVSAVSQTAVDTTDSKTTENEIP